MTAPILRTLVGTLPCVVDLQLYQGDDAHIDVTVTDPDGNPTDLTGYTAQAQIRKRPTEAIVLAAFTATITGNVIALDLPHGEADKLGSNATWDLQVTDPAGLIVTLAYGIVYVTLQVTRQVTP